jgi:hypothetical protein
LTYRLGANFPPGRIDAHELMGALLSSDDHSKGLADRLRVVH